MSQSIAAPPAPPALRLRTKLVGGYRVPILKKPYTKILKAIGRSTKRLDMRGWHDGKLFTPLTIEDFCGTVHCAAGWVTHLCGKQGFDLEMSLSGNTGDAARMILRASSELPIPAFCNTNARALAELRRLAAMEAEA